MKKLLIISLSSLVLEIGSTFYISYVSEKNLFGMALFAFIGPFLSLPFVGYIVQTKTWKERISIAIASAIGYSTGSIISYFFFQNLTK